MSKREFHNIENFNRLVEKGLVTKKVDDDGYITFKYKNKVFYNNLWHLDPLLLESRGIVFDPNGELVQLPFKKTFNMGENGVKCHRDRFVTASRKVNGFMTAATKERGKTFVSTTGTTTSEFAKLGKRYVDALNTNAISHKFTYIFEVCDESDPHIVAECPGIYLLGVRDKETGALVSPSKVQEIAERLGAFSVEYETMRFDQVVQESKTTEKEGFMVSDVNTNDHILKIKSPHYLSKKALMRIGRRKARELFNEPEQFRKMIDEEFYALHDHLLENYNIKSWVQMDEQERGKVIENFFSQE